MGPDHPLQQRPHQLPLLAQRGLVTDEAIRGRVRALGGPCDHAHRLFAGHAALLGADQHALAEFERGVVATPLAQQVQQVGLVEEDPVRRGGDAGPDPVLPLVLLTEGEQGLDLELHALGLDRVVGQGRLGVVQALLVLAAQQVYLGQGVVQGVVERLAGRLGQGQAGLHVGQGLVEPAQLAQGRAAYPQAVRLLRDPLEHALGQLDHLGPLLAEVGLEHQLGALVEVAARDRVERCADHGEGLVGPSRAIQRDDVALQQREHRAAHLAQRDLPTP